MEAAVPPFGWCGTLDEASLMHEAGLDHIELQIVPMQIDDPVAFARARARIADLPLPSLAMSYLFPHDMRIVGPEADERRIRTYFERVVALVAQAKARVVALGSGWSRDLPEGWSRAQTEDSLLRTLGWCAEALAGSGAVLAIEPLNRRESNLVNTLADAVRLARALGRPEVRVMADFYHMALEGEPMDLLREHGEWLAHVQVSDTGRYNPGTGTLDFATPFRHLKAIGYRGALTAECVARGELLPAMRDSREFVRRTWQAA